MPKVNRKHAPAGPDLNGLKVPKAVQPLAAEVMALTDAACREILDDEYARLARQVVVALARKRPSPLLSGRALTWAAGAVHAVGHVNFLYDRSSEPYVTADELSAAFGLAKNTISAKSRQIRDVLRMSHFSAEFMRMDMIERNPLAWMIMVDGLVYDARHLPREIQAEAFARGLIPYIPPQASTRQPLA